jgi:hypothetical protein
VYTDKDTGRETEVESLPDGGRTSNRLSRLQVVINWLTEVKQRIAVPR